MIDPRINPDNPFLTMSLTIPNCLTLFRILAIPLILLVYYSGVKYGNWYCTILFSLAGISDALDGHLARKWNQTSKVGAFLDPVADKLLVCIMLLIVVSNPILLSELWSKLAFTITVIVIISREITVSALREWMAEIGKRGDVAVSVVGKYKTGIQMGSIGCLLFKSDFIGLPILLIGEIGLYAAGVLTVWSMSIYLRAAYKAVNQD